MSKFLDSVGLEHLVGKLKEMFQPAGDYLSKETDPTVPSWAKQPNKPTYTAQEVGAMPAGTTIPSKTSQLANDSGYLKYDGTISKANEIAIPQSRGTHSTYTASVVNVARANRFAFMPADQVVILKTVDNGVTWTDAGFGNYEKQAVFADIGYAINIPKINNLITEGCGLRVYVTPFKYNTPQGVTDLERLATWQISNMSYGERYHTIDWIYIWLSSSSERIKFRLLNKNIGDVEGVIYESPDNMPLNGWSGPNIIPISRLSFGGSKTQINQTQWLCFEFMTKKTNANYNEAYRSQTQNISAIHAYGASCWSYGNSMMRADHLYQWDAYQNVAFPAQVKATHFAIGSTTLNESKLQALVNSTFLTSETDPTVPSWAKQPNKPTYTADDVGALPNTTFIGRIDHLWGEEDDGLSTFADVANSFTAEGGAKWTDYDLIALAGERNYTGSTFLVTPREQYYGTVYGTSTDGRIGWCGGKVTFSNEGRTMTLTKNYATVSVPASGTPTLQRGSGNVIITNIYGIKLRG